MEAITKDHLGKRLLIERKQINGEFDRVREIRVLEFTSTFRYVHIEGGKTGWIDLWEHNPWMVIEVLSENLYSNC
tara:strand:- start:1907 stop:2131 length:225 start_codon:yes stop_codon:yes gene_type:complete